MKTVKLYWSNVCILHKYEKQYLDNLVESLKDHNINLEITHFGIGYPTSLNKYLERDDAVIPDIIVSTDLEVFENQNIYNKFSNNLYNLVDYFPIKDSIKNSPVCYDKRLLPFLIIPLVFSYNNEDYNNINSIESLLKEDINVAIGGINNSGAKCIIKSIWDKYGKEDLLNLMKKTKVLNMPIQAFNEVKNGEDCIAITPSVYAKRANNKDLFINYPKEGAFALPSYICANKSIDFSTVNTVLSNLLIEEFCNFFVQNASLVTCLEGTLDEKFVLSNNNKFLYPSDKWLKSISSEEFYMYSSILFSTIIKGILIYFLALILSKLIGIKIISQMNFFDFIMGISVGSMIAKIIINKDHVVFSGVIALIVFTLLTIATSYLNLKSYTVRRIINAKTLILIENGRIIDKNMKRLRITINELMMKLREKDVFSLEDVQFAIMESNGQLSVLIKANKKPVTPYDMDLKVKSLSLTNDIIIDGKIIDKNLEIAGIDKKWLQSELKRKGINSIKEVFYAGLDQNKKLIISKKYSDSFNPENKFGIE
ncbi:putative membrane protein [Clostridium bornimense]|uniref:Putative membrane protein n=1 Tax=Clostridium bornimense TaxID=1216932 RepID=W6S359_9CLOT|nr:YetF domain-containing protein [Clostridium bornimense]CDM70349.1 putative membrane protein [Clostridium bornimense]